MSGEDWLGILTALIGGVMAVQPKRSTRFFVRYAFSNPPFFTRVKPFSWITHIVVFALGVAVVAASLVGIFEL